MPYKHKVTGSNPVPATIKIEGQTFFCLTFSFSRAIRASKCPTNSRQSATQGFRPYIAPIKNGRRPTPTPENQRAFTLKARLSSAGKRTRLPLYGPGTHRCPGENPPYAPQARFLHANSKRPPAQPTALKLYDSHVATRKTPNGYVETCRADAPRFIPLARPSRPRASRAHGQAMSPWRRRRAYGRSRRAARQRTTAADRSGASHHRRLSW